MSPDQNRLYLGIKGHVVCIRKEDGKELWRSHLKGGGFTNVVVEPDGLFAYTRGVLYALDPASGNILWSNELRRLGFDACTITSANQTPVVVAAIKAAQAQAAAASSSASHG